MNNQQIQKYYVHLLDKDLTLSRQAMASDVGPVAPLPVPSPALLQPAGQVPPACSCHSYLPQEAQPVEEAQALGSDEGVFPHLGDHYALLLIRQGSA